MARTKDHQFTFFSNYRKKSGIHPTKMSVFGRSAKKKPNDFHMRVIHHLTIKLSCHIDSLSLEDRPRTESCFESMCHDCI